MSFHRGYVLHMAASLIPPLLLPLNLDEHFSIKIQHIPEGGQMHACVLEGIMSSHQTATLERGQGYTPGYQLLSI